MDLQISRRLATSSFISSSDSVTVGFEELDG